MSLKESRRGRAAFWLSVAACGWSAALVGGAFTVPMYSSSSTSSFGVHIAESMTLVQVNGLLVLIPVGVPLLIAVAVWAALHRKCSRGSNAAGAAAAVLVTVLTLGCLIGLASIGVLVIPVALLLGYAVAITPSGDSSRRLPDAGHWLGGTTARAHRRVQRSMVGCCRPMESQHFP